MSTLTEDVFEALSSIPGARVYPDVLPQNVTLPALVFTLIWGQDDFHLGGLSGLGVFGYQVDSWAGTRLSADSLIEQARLAMVASTDFQTNAISVPGVDTFEPETLRYRSSREFTIWRPE